MKASTRGPGGGVGPKTSEEAEGAANDDADEEEEIETDDVSGGKVNSGLKWLFFTILTIYKTLKCTGTFQFKECM